MQDAKRLPELVAKIHRHAHDHNRCHPPAGPTESLLGLEAWRDVEAANPVLAEMDDDVEALLVNRAKGARRQWIVPIEDCYALVGLIRTRWRGLTGGDEVWEEIDGFFRELDAKCAPSGRE